MFSPYHTDTPTIHLRWISLLLSILYPFARELFILHYQPFLFSNRRLSISFHNTPTKVSSRLSDVPALSFQDWFIIKCRTFSSSWCCWLSLQLSQGARKLVTVLTRPETVQLALFPTSALKVVTCWTALASKVLQRWGRWETNVDQPTAVPTTSKGVWPVKIVNRSTQTPPWTSPYAFVDQTSIRRVAPAHACMI